MRAPTPEPAADLHVDADRGGWTQDYDARRVPPMRQSHRHDELEVNLVLRGWAEYLIGDRRLRFPRYGLGWLLPHQTHRLIDRSPDLRMWIAVFRQNLLPERDRADTGPPRGWLREGSCEPPVRMVGEEAVDLARLFGQLADGEVSAARQRVGLTWLLSECWEAYRRAPDLPGGVHLHPAVESAAGWLYDHAADPEADDLAALARRSGVSRPWLSRLFQEQLGESLTDFRNRQRLYRFRAALAQPGPVSVTAAALAAGFGSYAQCFRVVRRHTGRSPRDLRRGLREPLGRP